jgi:ribonuclease J
MALEIGERMKIKILKGTNKIGGCITEITSRKAKIIIDFGEDLPNVDVKSKKDNPLIEGLTHGSKGYDAVFITHNHSDHIGLISNVLPEIPIYVEKTSKEIFNVLNAFVGIKKNHSTVDMIEERPVIVGDFKVTPYIVDHSAYNSLMLLIESDGKRILHTGDFRNHGYKGRFLDNILRKIGKVDVVITEGTSFGRNNKKNKTEEELSTEATEIMTLEAYRCFFRSYMYSHFCSTIIHNRLILYNWYCLLFLYLPQKRFPYSKRKPFTLYMPLYLEHRYKLNKLF